MKNHICYSRIDSHFQVVTGTSKANPALLELPRGKKGAENGRGNEHGIWGIHIYKY